MNVYVVIDDTYIGGLILGVYEHKDDAIDCAIDNIIPPKHIMDKFSTETEKRRYMYHTYVHRESVK